MKKLGLVVVVGLMVVSSARAQGLGVMPIARTGVPVELGTFDISGGMTIPLGDDFTTMGVRGTYGLADNISLVLDLGRGRYVNDGDGVDTEYGICYAASLEYEFNLGLPFNVSTRVSLNGGKLEEELTVSGVDADFEMELLGLGGLIILSGPGFDVPYLTLYGAAGMWAGLGNWELSDAAAGTRIEDGEMEDELVIGWGVAYETPLKGLSVWAEMVMMDNVHLNGGATFAF